MTATAFTPDDLKLLTTLPSNIGGAMAVVGRSGVFGTLKEMFADAQAMMAGAKDHPGNALIRAILPDPAAADRWAEIGELRQARDWNRERIKAKNLTSREDYVAMVLADCRTAAALLAAKAQPEEAAGYKAWALGIAEKVANAASEGGFFGFGGERLSDDEKKFLGELKTALDA